MRATARAIRRSAAAQTPNAGAHLAARVDALPWPPGVVAGYWPIDHEIDPRPLMNVLAGLGHDLALPAIEGSAIRFRRWNPDLVLEVGPLGTRQPPAAAPVVIPSVVLVPLLAFDRAGRRLGFGKGYYDRALAGDPPRLIVGIAFAAQEVPRVPSEDHDVRLDWIMTERQAIRVS